MNKFFYLYKITNHITGEYYYGVHETSDLNDGYFGSGSVLKENIKKYGLEHFSKELLKFFPNRSELMKEEKKIVNKDMLKDPLCLNVMEGGGEMRGSVGMKCVVDENGNYRMVDKNDNEYQNFFTGRVCINKLGVMKYINRCELDYYLEKGWSKGTIYPSPGKGKVWVCNSECRRQVDPTDLQEYLDHGWRRGFTNGEKKIWIHRDDSRIQIPQSDLQWYEREGWVKGFGKSTVRGKVLINKDNTKKYVNHEDLQQYVNEGWKKSTWKNTVWITKDTVNKRIDTDDFQRYVNEGWRKGRYNENNSKRRGVLLYDTEGVLIRTFAKVSDANKAGFNNIQKYAGTGKIYMGRYIVEYKKEI